MGMMTAAEKELYELGRVLKGYLSWIDPNPNGGDEDESCDQSKGSVEELATARSFFKSARAYYLKADMAEPEREVALTTIESLGSCYRYPPFHIDEAFALKERISSMQATPAELHEYSRVMNILYVSFKLGRLSAEDAQRLNLS